MAHATIPALRRYPSMLMPTPRETARDLLAAASLCHAARQHAAGADLTALAAALLAEGEPQEAPWPRSPGSGRTSIRLSTGCQAPPRRRQRRAARGGNGS